MSKSNSREVHGSAAPREYHRRSMNLHPLSFATRLVAVVLPLALASVASAQSPLGVSQECNGARRLCRDSPPLLDWRHYCN